MRHMEAFAEWLHILKVNQHEYVVKAPQVTSTDATATPRMLLLWYC